MIFRSRRRWASVFLAFAAIWLASAGLALAQDHSLEQRFKGKQIRVLIGSSAGGGYDTFARAIAAHWSKHMPGNPQFVPQNMPGPMSLSVANHVFSIAPKDGTVIGAVNPQIATEAILHPDRARFDARQLVWIGSALRETQVVVARSDAGLRTFADAFEKELILGGSGGASNSFPAIVNAVLGTRFKIVSGYPGTRESNLAMERGEVQGIGGITWASVKATMGDLLAGKKLVVLGQYGLKKHPELPDVTEVLSFAKTPEDRSALLLLLATQEFGRPFIAPPGLPDEIAGALRASFIKTLDDPEFLAETKKRGLDIDPTPGEEIQSLVAQLYATSPETVERVRAIFAQTGK
jgi:tripartite-type tricarboxylate transporter receptor subunit TctC